MKNEGKEYFHYHWMKYSAGFAKKKVEILGFQNEIPLFYPFDDDMLKAFPKASL